MKKMLCVAINTKKLSREMDTKGLLRAEKLHGVAPLGLTVEPTGSLMASSCMQAWQKQGHTEKIKKNQY